MKIQSNITSVKSIKGGGWCGVVDAKTFKPAPRWFGLTPEEAYRKGIKDAEDDARMREIRKLPIKCKKR